MNTVVRVAFELGDDIVSAGGGYRFLVHLDGGHSFEGVPEHCNESDETLILDNVGGTPTPVIDMRSIIAITVLEV